MILCSNVAQAVTEINNAITVVTYNSFYVEYIKENIGTAAFPCKPFKGVSTWGKGREQKIILHSSQENLSSLLPNSFDK